MALQTTSLPTDTPTADCCTTDVQAGCCQPEAKAACWDTAAGMGRSSCGCNATP